MKKHATQGRSAELGSTLRSVVSLLLVLHIVCVVCVLSANVSPSPLQTRLAGTFAPYTQLLHFHPGFARFQFTAGDTFSDEHFLIIETKAGSSRVRLPGDESTWGWERQRLAALGLEVALFADRDELAGYYAKSVGGRILREKKLAHAVVSCVHKLSQPLDPALLDPSFPPNQPNASEYFNTVYQAEVWFDAEGTVEFETD